MNSQTTTAILCVFAVVSICHAGQTDLDFGDRVKGDEDVLLVHLYGTSDVTVVTNGHLFVNGRYVPEPYRVQRIGQGIVVNGVLVNVPFKRDPSETEKAGRHWQSPWHGFEVDTPKKLADMQMRWKIIDQLRVGRAVFVAPQTEGNPPFGLRTTAKLKGAVFDEALAVVASDRSKQDKLDALKQLWIKGLVIDGGVSAFYDACMQSTGLLQRVVSPAPVDGKVRPVSP